MKQNLSATLVCGCSLIAAFLLAGCGGRGEPTIQANAQTISFGAAPTLTLGGTATVSAIASSGLAVRYSSTTPAVCSVDGITGLVTDIALGSCIIAADQSGNTGFAPAAQVTQSISVIFNPNQTIGFGAVPALTIYGSETITATASSGLAISYSSITPGVCSVNSSTGVVTDLTSGSCIIAADQAGDTNYNPAPQVTQTLIVAPWAGPITVPGAPTGISATLDSGANTVTVSFTGPASSGGSPVTVYTVNSNPAGITATGASSPVTAPCMAPCTGYTFSVIASNAAGDSAASAQANVLTAYNVVETFIEPMTQPNNSIFIGSFTFDSTTGTVSNLHGILSESMTGGQIPYPNDSMTWLPLNYQLSAVPVTLGGVDGLLVTAFMNNNTNTLSTNPTYGGTDGWAPGTGLGLYYGFQGVNPGNAYAMIFVNTADPTTALTQSQIDKLAYADCTQGGMMGATCMTGTTVAGYGTVGSMSGYPSTLVITKQ